ncbi:MAG: alpha/beta family hydrolase [Planctomycetota bacterium]
MTEASTGFPVLRFEYPYMQKARATGRRRPPDRAPALEEAHRDALLALASRLPGKRILSAGKSLGGRIASRIAAQGTDDGLTAGLVFFGYPLHPAKRQDKLRSEHFAALAEPALFLQGTRDALCDLPLLRRELERYGGEATLHVVEGADHGFDVLVRSGRTQPEVLEELCDAVDRFEAERFPSG